MGWYDNINNGVQKTQNGLATQQAQIFNNAGSVGAGLARVATMPTANTGSTWKNIASNIGGAMGATTNVAKTPAFTFDIGNNYAGSYNNFMKAANNAGITDMGQKQALWQNWTNQNVNFDDANGLASINEGANGAIDATTDTQLNTGGAMQAGLQALQAGLAVYNAIQADKAVKESKRQFDKQWKYAVTDFNNYKDDRNARRRSSTNIGSSLMGLNAQEAKARQDYASQFDLKGIEE